MFLDPRSFPFVEGLEASWTLIRDELATLSRDDFIHYGQAEAHGGEWLVFPLVNRIPWVIGERTDEVAAANRRRCPRTLALIAGIEGLTVASFSLLSPGAHIYRHLDYAEPAGYRCHLGLVCNPGARMASAGRVQSWREGRCLVFDPAHEHEAANDGDRDRVIFMIDVLASRYPARPLASGESPVD